MFECEICNKSFKSSAGLNGHKRAHGPSNGSYTVNRKKHSATPFNCLNCGKHGTYLPAQSSGKYCSNTCQHDYNWKLKYIPLIESNACNNKVHLKKYLKETQGDQCKLCGQLPFHNGQPLVLQMDHIDGNSDNNFISNLRLLCPNCHTQTPTFCSKKNSKKHKQTKRNSYLREYQKRATE